MLSNFKEKFLNVSKNVKFLQNEKNKAEDPVNFDAGADILDHFKNEWELFHETNENNTKKASKVAESVKEIHANLTKEKNNVKVITEVLTNSNLISNINGIDKQIRQLYDLCENVEKSLITLENVIDEIDFQKMKNQHKYHLMKYKERKTENLRALELKLKDQKADELKQLEIENSKKMEERQQVFQEAFRNDLELFKSLGQIPKVELSRKQPSALLEEFQVDVDENELNQFFEEN
ncbi:hypothetical protein WA026_013299 [Henosepilachna vigintioctopunctata]|uniref:Dysbindin n=1 Tax=Henosepilachna vigintioctopunctata TaxID=420089 RepID=A0AAW1VD16_9CUCU